MFILDCSIVMAACLGDEQSEYADQILASLEHQTALVPALWSYEIGNTLLVAERRKRIRVSQRIQCLNAIALLPIEYQPAPSISELSAVISLAQPLGLSFYDASYLELAIQKKLPLASLDSKLTKAAALSGVDLYQVKQ